MEHAPLPTHRSVVTSSALVPNAARRRRSGQAGDSFIHARLNGPARHVRIGPDPFLDDIYWIVGLVAFAVLFMGVAVTVVRL